MGFEKECGERLVEIRGPAELATARCHSPLESEPETLQHLLYRACAFLIVPLLAAQNRE